MTFDAGTAQGARALGRLASDRIGWLTSGTPGGQPQTFPIWFLWEDGTILVYSDRRARRNNANVAANPRVSFHLDTNDGGGDVVVVEGEAVIDPTVPPVTEHPGYLTKYGRWIDEYLGGATEMAEVYSVPLRIHPTRVRTSEG